jgi:glycosyltransferase involved in cell wall biosynthesis
VITVADYFPVCSHYDLLDPSKQYCNIPQRPITTCDVCLHDQDEAAYGSQASRRSFVSAVLEYVDVILLNSDAEREIIQSVYPALRKNPRVFVEGCPVAAKPPPLKVRTDGGVLRVAVPGNFYQLKGAEVLCRVFHTMREDAVEFHIYGHILPDYAERLQALHSPNLHIHGAYSPDVFHDRLLEADVSLHLSIWPETYVLTLSESWRAGLLPIVTDTGALGERISHRVNGLKVPVGDAGSVVQLVRELIADRGELERMRRNIHQGLYRTLEEHVKIMTGVYEQVSKAYRLYDRSDAFFREYPNPRPASAATIFRRDSIWLKKAPEKRMPDGPDSGSGEQLLAIAPVAGRFEEDASGWYWVVMARRAKHYMAKHGAAALVARSIKALIHLARK